MKNMIFAVAFLALLALNYAEFVAALDIQVGDQDLRPIEGAKIEVKYQLSTIQGSITTIPKYTDENGRINITIRNVEYNPAKTDKNFQVIATYGGKTSTVSYTIDKHPSTIVLQVPAYVITVFVRDQKGKVLPGKVTVLGVEKDTDATGRAVFHVAGGQQEIKVNYNGIEKKVSLDVAADASREFVYPLYDLTVKVVDEQGRPLLATVGKNGEYVNTDVNGEARFTNVPQDSPQITAKYGNLQKNAEPYLPSENEVTFAFDVSPPQISNITAQYVSGFVRLRARIKDEGEYSSGFSEDTPFYVDYRVEGNRRQTDMYPVGNDHYEAELQTLKKSSEIPYTISASDEDGNRNSVSGMYNLSISVSGGGFLPGGSGGEAAGGEEGGIFGIDLKIIIGGIVAVIGLGAVYWYLKRGEESD